MDIYSVIGYYYERQSPGLMFEQDFYARTATGNLHVRLTWEQPNHVQSPIEGEYSGIV